MSVVDAVLGRLRYFQADVDHAELGKVYSGLLEQPGTGYANFVQLDYFRQCRGPIERMQDIPPRYLQQPEGAAKLFVSHKWETVHHPDPSRRTLDRLLSLTNESDGSTGVWLDYCCLPQRKSADGSDDRSPDHKTFFRFELSLIPLVILDSQCMFLWADEGWNSGWCTLELLIAQALRQHINRFVYERRQQLDRPPLFALRVGEELVIDSDLVRFQPRILEKIYCDPVARARHDEILVWMNGETTGGAPTPYSEILRRADAALVTRMVEELRLVFRHAPDADFVPKMLHRLYEHLSGDPFVSFRWKGRADLLSMWHYVRGALGNGLLPASAYQF